MPALKLQYLPIQGRAEGIRMFLLHSGIEYEDAVLEFDVFARAKECGALPFGQVRPSGAKPQVLYRINHTDGTKVF